MTCDVIFSPPHAKNRDAFCSGNQFLWCTREHVEHRRPQIFLNMVILPLRFTPWKIWALIGWKRPFMDQENSKEPTNLFITQKFCSLLLPTNPVQIVCFQFGVNLKCEVNASAIVRIEFVCVWALSMQTKHHMHFFQLQGPIFAMASPKVKIVTSHRVLGRPQ